MQLFAVICQDAKQAVTYTVHVPAETSQSASDRARTMGHSVISASAANPDHAWDRFRNWAGGVTQATHCPRCKYALDGLVLRDGAVRCPECGGLLRIYVERR